MARRAWYQIMEVLRVVYEIAVIILALMALVVWLIVAVVIGGIAFGIHRWGSKAVAGAHTARLKVDAAEHVAHRGIQRGVVRPAAKAHSMARWLSAFGRRALDEP
ncbi:MAG: hypothetical protein CL878_04955 [Dehalococcoidia bacterium]|nr:hypothetical protein [Dehalococcoidia bacterium]